jgi:hypothetical protein
MMVGMAEKAAFSLQRVNTHIILIKLQAYPSKRPGLTTWKYYP